MQTFLPYKSFSKSAKVLDRQRLGKQRVECMQLLKTLVGESNGWKNHPATLMWVGSEYWLFKYLLAICKEWKSRGYKDTCVEKVKDFIKGKILGKKYPKWLGKKKFHSSHRSNLLRKMPELYSKFGWKEPSDLPYYWPVTL